MICVCPALLLLTAITELLPSGSVCRLPLLGISVTEPGFTEDEVETHTGLVITDDDTGSSTEEGDDEGLEGTEESGWKVDADDAEDDGDDDDDTENNNNCGDETGAADTAEVDDNEAEEEVNVPVPGVMVVVVDEDGMEWHISEASINPADDMTASGRTAEEPEVAPVDEGNDEDSTDEDEDGDDDDDDDSDDKEAMTELDLTDTSAADVRARVGVSGDRFGCADDEDAGDRVIEDGNDVGMNGDAGDEMERLVTERGRNGDKEEDEELPAIGDSTKEPVDETQS